MKSLYKFILDESTGNIDVLEIKEYEEGDWSNRGKCWTYRGKSCWIHVFEKRLDKYLSGHVYSFNSSIVDARLIIADAIYAKAEKAKREYERWNDVFEKLRRD